VRERRRTPLRQEVVLVLDTRVREVLAAYDAATRIRLADLLVGETANGAVTAGEESQLRRQRVEIVHEHRTEPRTQQRPAVLGDAPDPFRVRAGLQERRIRQR